MCIIRAGFTFSWIILEGITDIGAVSQLQPASSLGAWYDVIYSDKLLQRICNILFLGGGQGCGVADESTESKQAKGLF